MTTLVALVMLVAAPVLKSVLAQTTDNRNRALGSVSGVITIYGLPAAGVNVTLTNGPIDSPDAVLARAETDEAGRYQFSGIASGYYYVKVARRGYTLHQPKGLGFVALQDGEFVDDLNLELVKGGVVSGRVTDQRGAPVAGEQVYLCVSYRSLGPPDSAHYRPRKDWRHTAKTNHRGEYRIEGVIPDNYLVAAGEDIVRLTGQVWDKNDLFSWVGGRVSSDRYYEQTFAPGVTATRDAREVQVDAGGDLSEINIIVGKRLRSYSASGKIVDQAGKPIAGARIRLGHRTVYGSTSTDDVSSDGQERFHIDKLIPGRFFVSTSLDHQAPFYSNTVEFEIKNRDVSGIQIVAIDGFPISGSVLIETASRSPSHQLRPFDRLEIHAREDYRAREDWISRIGSVGDDGRFIIRGLRQTPTKIDVSQPAGGGDRYYLKRIEYQRYENGPLKVAQPEPIYDGAWVELSDGGLHGVRVVLGICGSVRGRILVKGGFPKYAGIRLSIEQDLPNGTRSSTSGEIDPNGNIYCGYLTPGQYEFRVSGDGFSSASTSLKVDEGSQHMLNLRVERLKTEKRSN